MRILPHSEQGCSRCKSIEQLLETQERAIELLLESQKAITQLLRAHRGAPRTEKKLDVPPNRVIRQRIRQKRYRRRKRIREIPRERLERLERILFPTKQTMPTPSPLSARRIEELEERISKHGMQRTRELRMLEYGPVDPIRFEEAMSAIEDHLINRCMTEVEEIPDDHTYGEDNPATELQDHLCEWAIALPCEATELQDHLHEWAIALPCERGDYVDYAYEFDDELEECGVVL